MKTNFDNQSSTTISSGVKLNESDQKQIAAVDAALQSLAIHLSLKKIGKKLQVYKSEGWGINTKCPFKK